MPIKRLDIWVPTYLMTAPERAIARYRRRDRLTHILFLICDHFEPQHGVSNDKQAEERLVAWQEGYATLRRRCESAFGAAPRHSWFFPPHHGLEHLARFSDMVYDGLGEVELHYHHRDDTAETLTKALRDTLANFHRWGFLLEVGNPPKTRFGFIHGDWALDNSAHGKHCGVNNELSILEQLGCWGDFTMPSGNECQTRKINSIYYAKGREGRSKAHNWGRDASVGETDTAGLFMMQGPLGINWGAPRYPRVENASITSSNWGRPDRIERWLDSNVHVRGRPEWVFVKLHAHGAIERDFDALFGERAFAMHQVLQRRYNDGSRYQMHYVTARQAFNIAKAAEHGRDGDPSQWVDFCVQPQPHSLYSINCSHNLVSCTAARLTLSNIDSRTDLVLRSRVGPLKRLRGPLSEISIDEASQRIELGFDAPGDSVSIELEHGFHPILVEGSGCLLPPSDPSRPQWTLNISRAGRIAILGAAAFAA